MPIKWELELTWQLGVAVGVALLLGALVAYLLTRSRMDKNIQALQEKNNTLYTKLQVEQAQYVEKIEALKESRTQLKESFSALSKHALDANNESFLQLAQQKLGLFETRAQANLTEKEKSIYPPTGERTSNHHLPILLLPILTWLDLVVNLSVSTKRTYSNRFHQTTREKRFQDFYQSLPPHPVIHIYSSVKAAGLFSRNAAIPWNTNKNRSIGGTSDCRQHPKEDV